MFGFSPFTFYEKNGRVGERGTRSDGRGVIDERIGRVEEEEAEESEKGYGRVTSIVPAHRTAGIKKRGTKRAQREVDSGSDRVTKAPLRMAKRLELAKGVRCQSFLSHSLTILCMLLLYHRE